MTMMVVPVTASVKRELRRMRRQTRDKGLANRCQMVLLASQGHTRRAIAEAVGCSESWVYQVLARFRQRGTAALPDGREDNGELKLDERFLSLLHGLVGSSPQDHGHPRPTWTQELLVKVMQKQTGVKVHVGTMSRALKKIGARLGRPRPTVGCPWSSRAKKARLRVLDRLIDSLPADEALVYLDEVDIHLNPKIGPDWMNKGTQKTVRTPGKNVKRYLCGALDVQSDRILRVAGPRKNSGLFIDTLARLTRVYAGKRRIHVILEQLPHPRLQGIAGGGARVRRKNRAAFFAAVLPGGQPHRAGMAQPPRGSDTQSLLWRHRRTDGRYQRLAHTPQPTCGHSRTQPSTGRLMLHSLRKVI